MARLDLNSAAVAAFVLAISTLVPSSVAVADSMSKLGADEFQSYCANCHGIDGKGSGDMADLLTVKPADLTILAKNNGGSFPRDHVVAVIDGRMNVRAHGSRDMPIWGYWFSKDVARQQIFHGAAQDVAVEARIDALAAYIETLQEK